MSMQYAQGYGTTSVGADLGGASAGEPLNLGPNIFPAQPGQLPPEAYQSQTPTVRTLPPKIVKNTLPPQYKTNTLPPKVVTTRLQPIFPPAGPQSSVPPF